MFSMKKYAGGQKVSINFAFTQEKQLVRKAYIQGGLVEKLAENKTWSANCSNLFCEHGSTTDNPLIRSTDFVIPEVALRLSGIQRRRRFSGYRIAIPSRPV